jgi:hypothetical protein
MCWRNTSHVLFAYTIDSQVLAHFGSLPRCVAFLGFTFGSAYAFGCMHLVLSTKLCGVTKAL